MLVSVSRQWMGGALIALLCSLGVAQELSASGPMSLDAIIQAVEKAQAAKNPNTSYQVIREYRLFGAKDAKADSEVVAEINFRPPAFRDYTIQRSSGSSRGPQLVRRILDHEVKATAQGNRAGSAITSDNYNFSYVGEAEVDGHPCYVLALKPKRSDNNLISGQAWVDQNSFLIRQVEGEVEKPPSWWLKAVRIKLVFADLDGIWVQRSLEATADVRMVGSRTLTSRILDYRREDEVAATSFSGGSSLPKR